MIYKRTFADVYVPLLPRLCDGLDVHVTKIGPARNAVGALGKTHVVTLDVRSEHDYVVFNDRVRTMVELVTTEAHLFYAQPHVSKVRRVCRGRNDYVQVTDILRTMTVVLTKMPW